MRLLLIVNSFASSVTARSMVVIRKAFAADHDVEMVETSRRGHATRLARGAANEGYDGVVVMGGDGTLNEAANGLVDTDTALVPLPGGSTNVFARTIGIPNDPVEATGVLIDAMARGSVRRIGVGSVNDRCFLFHTGVGFDAAVVEQVERRSSLKRWAGHPLFVYSALATWSRHYDHSRPRMSVSIHARSGADDGGGGQSIPDGYMALVLNSDPYTYLGNRPLSLAPSATLDRGLAVVVLRTMDLIPVLRLVGSAIGSGRHLRRSHHASIVDDVTTATIRGNGPVPYQVDGDFLGTATDLRFEHRSAALRLVVPAPRPGNNPVTFSLPRK